MKVGRITGVPFVLYYQERDEKEKQKGMEKKEEKKKETREKSYLHLNNF